MIRFLIRLAIYVGTAALALLVASWILPGFTLTLSGFIIAVAVFALAQRILTPFIVNMARKYAPAALGASGSSRRSLRCCSRAYSLAVSR